MKLFGDKFYFNHLTRIYYEKQKNYQTSIRDNAIFPVHFFFGVLFTKL